MTMKSTDRPEDAGMFPPDYIPHGTVRIRLGSLSFATSDDPAVFWIVAQGFITPGLIRDEFSLIESFARQHPEGWDYVVDTRRVSMIHPWNPMLLRKVRDFPNNRRYIILAPALVRFLGRMVSWLIRPTHITGSTDEIKSIVAEHSQK